MNSQRFGSVWYAIEDTPAAAENMRLRSILLTALKTYLIRAEIDQAEVAKRLGVTEPRLSELIRGKIDVFSLDALVAMATSAGLRIEMLVVEAS